MNTLLILIGCLFLGGAFAVVISAAVLGARVERNRRAHRLGQLPKASHPEWN